MKTYRKMAELLLEDLSDLCPELVKELLYYVWLMETNYPDDENSAVLLLDNEEELGKVLNLFPFLNDTEPEINETTICDGNVGYRCIVWVAGQDGSGIVALWEFDHEL